MGSLFDDNKCGLPAVPPLDDLPFIDDCSVPDAPPQFSDCPDVDLPFPIAGPAGGAGGPGPIGPQGEPGADGQNGQDGQDGQDGADGCDPEIQVNATVQIVNDASLVRVTVNVTSCGYCCYRINFTFYLLGAETDDCCEYIWCCEAPASSGCCTGGWQIRKGGGCAAPCIDGCCNGEIMVICNCSSSATACIYCSGTPPDYVQLDIAGVTDHIGGTPCTPPGCVNSFNTTTFTLTQTSPCQYAGTFSVDCGTYTFTLTHDAAGSNLVISDGAGGTATFKHDGALSCTSPNTLSYDNATTTKCTWATASVTLIGS